MRDPVAEDNDFGFIVYRKLNRNMAVPKNKVINFRHLLRLILGILEEHLVLWGSGIFLLTIFADVSQAASARPVQTHFGANIGVQPSEEKLVGLEFKNLFQEFVTFVTRAQAIAMSEKKRLTIKFPDYCFSV